MPIIIRLFSPISINFTPVDTTVADFNMLWMKTRGMASDEAELVRALARILLSTDDRALI
jgi:hypothetical protein